MKRIYWVFIAVIAITLLILLFSYINRDRMMDRMIEMGMNKSDFKKELLEDFDGIRIFTLGTASALPDDYNQTGTAIFAGGFFFLFDVGDGVVKEAEKLRLPLPSLDAVFISHYHSDHYIELPYVINRSWVLGRKDNLTIFGPPGIDSILKGIDIMLQPENQFRIDHHGNENMNLQVSSSVSEEIRTATDNSAVIFDKEGVKVTAFEVCHPPITPSFGFKIEYKNKSVVISGDTKENCNNLLKYAQNADVLIHEVMLKDLVIKSSEINNGNGNKRNADIAKDITDYHTDPFDVGILADKANVGKLILHHFAPVPSNIILRRRYRFAIRKNFKGPLSLAEDGKEYYVK